MRTRWNYLPLLLLLLVAPSMQQAREKLDLVFVVDGSDRVGSANFAVLKQTILQYVVPQMKGSLHVGFAFYSTNLNAVINLTPDPQLLSDTLSSLNYIGGQTNTNIGLQWGLSVLLSTSTRPGTPQDMIVVVAGTSPFPQETKSVAEFVRDMAVSITAVGIGSNVTEDELLSISGSASRILTSNTFSALPAIDLNLATDGPTVAPPTTVTTPTRPTTPTTRPTTPTTRPTTPTTQPTTPRTLRPTTPTTPPTPRPTTTTTPRTRPSTTPFRTTSPVPTRTTPRTVATTTRTTTPRMTTTTRRAPTTPYVRPYLNEGLCEKATIVNGVGYRAHPTDADKYVQCYFPREQRTLAVVRECPFGLLYDAHARLCVPYLRMRLARDPCETGRVRAHPHEGNCRTFYHCEGRRSVPRCCPAGYLFDAPSQGCSPCPACSDPCPALCDVVRVACNKYPVFDDMSVYRKWTREGDVIVPCQNGSVFDISACKCVHYTYPAQCTPEVEVPFRSPASSSSWGVDKMTLEDVRLTGNEGIFDGVTSRLGVRTQAVNTFERPMVMRFTYRENSDITSPVALASTSRCEFGGLILISLERGGLKIEMSSYGRTPIIFRLPTAGFKKSDMKELLFYHDREYLGVALVSGKLAYIRRAKIAVLPYTHCGLDFGNSEWMKGFNGTISKVQLLRCRPADFELF